MDETIFFYGGVYSQWYPSPIVIDDVEYNCAEQYMMAQKALTFNDTESWVEIMKAWHPSQQKAIGRKVKGFNVDEWNNVCKDIVYKANMAKFTQHETLKEGLLATGDSELVEASPTDVVWGIGLAENNPDINDRSKWRGTNWLGEVIMKVRATIRQQI
jgi:ribA/ribD-fused uncharacterized protein